MSSRVGAPWCVASGKRSYESYADAEEALRRVRRRRRKGRRENKAYRCPECGQWHLMSNRSRKLLGGRPRRELPEEEAMDDV